jgi:hypothetical protein
VWTLDQVAYWLQQGLWPIAGNAAPIGLFGGGFGASSTNIIDFINIPSAGNATDFGDLTVARQNLAACSSSTRGVFGGGNTSGNTIDYVTITSAGNALDFGDLSSNPARLGACSSSTRGIFAGGEN